MLPSFLRASMHMLAALLASLPAAAAAEAWRSAEEPGTLAFTPTFEGQDIPGAFRRFEVRLDGAPGTDRDATLVVCVDITSVSFDDDDVQAEVTGPDWFDAARFPTANFESQRIAQDAGGAWRAEGRLTLKGATRPLTLPFRFEGGQEDARISGTVVLDRRSFGIGAGDWSADDSIGFAVPVRFEARLRRDDAR